MMKGSGFGSVQIMTDPDLGGLKTRIGSPTLITTKPVLESLKTEFTRAWLNLSRMSLPIVSATCWLMLKSVKGISVPKQKNHKFS
jgi:hypothetical protein